MDIDKLYDIIENFFGYKCKMMGIDSRKQEVFCILYDSFWLISPFITLMEKVPLNY